MLIITLLGILFAVGISLVITKGIFRFSWKKTFQIGIGIVGLEILIPPIIIFSQPTISIWVLCVALFITIAIIYLVYNKLKKYFRWPVSWGKSFLQLVSTLAITCFIGVFWFFYCFATGIEGSNAGWCKRNLIIISKSLHQYAQEHGQRFPEHLVDLYPKYVNDNRIFFCPRGFDEHRNFPDVFSDENIDYQYTKGLTENVKPTAILLQDKPGNHMWGVCHILFVDGHVETKNNPPWYSWHFYFGK